MWVDMDTIRKSCTVKLKRNPSFLKNPDIKSGIYSSFDIDTSSSENDKLEIRTNQSKDRTTVDW